ncbi:MAG TPA: translocation/assembly module TamB domain-containing protein [Amoebophilaceae bacterium]|nr:translocation/assembly module TamB domain-containing protein [Amoebophilaceae bacterium]
MTLKNKIVLNLRKLKQWSVTLVKGFVLGAVLLCTTLFVLLQFPVLQQNLAHRLLDHVYAQTAYRIHCQVFRFRGCKFDIQGVSVQDSRNQVLCTIESCRGSLNLFRLLVRQSGLIDTVTVTGTQLYIEQMDAQSNSKSFYTNLLLPIQSEKAMALSISNLLLQDFNVRCRNVATQQDLWVQKMGLQVKNFCAQGGCYKGDLMHLSYQGTNAFPLIVNNARAHFSITPTYSKLDHFQVVTQKSCIQGSMVLNHPKMNSLLSEAAQIEVEATLQGTRLASVELAIFWKGFKGIDVNYTLEGKLALTPQALGWKDCLLTVDRTGGYLKSSGNWPWSSNTAQASLCITDGLLHKQELASHFPKEIKAQHPIVTTLAYVRLQDVALIGNAAKAACKGIVHSNLGRSQIELTLMDFNKDLQQASYVGKIGLQALAIDQLNPSIPVTELTAALSVEGQGLPLESGTAAIFAHIPEIKTDAYAYKQIGARATLSKGLLSFSLESKDPNLLLSLAGSYQVDRHMNLQADGIVERCCLEKLTLSKKPLQLGTQFSFTIHDLLAKMPTGMVSLKQFQIQSVDKKITAKNITLLSKKQGVTNLVTLTSPLLDAQAKGTFTLKSLVQHMETLRRTWDPLATQVVSNSIPPLAIAYTLRYKEGAPLLHWFSSDWEIAPETTFTGCFSYHQDYDFSLNVRAETLSRLRALTLEQVVLQLTAQAFNNPNKRSVQLTVCAGRQDWFRQFQAENVSLECRIERAGFSLSVLDHTTTKDPNRIALTCSGKLLKDAIQVALDPSEFVLADKRWKLRTERPSLIRREAIEVGKIYITSGEEQIVLGGTFSKLPTIRPLRCNISNLGVRYHLPAVEATIQGKLHTHLVLQRKKGHLVFVGNLTLEQCLFKDQHLGNFHTKLSWHEREHAVTLEGRLQKQGETFLQVGGRYFPGKAQNSLDLVAVFQRMNLQGLNPLTEPIFSNIKGKLSGTVAVTGTLDAPQFNGETHIDKGQLQINYLNTLYQATGRFQIKNNTVTVEKLHLQDHEKGNATLTGTITLQKDFPLLLTGRVEDLHLLNTTVAHQPDFFGSLYATGTLVLKGPVTDLVLQANATANRGKFTVLSHERQNVADDTTLVQFIHKKQQPTISHPEGGLLPKDEARTDFRVMLELKVLPSVTSKVVFGSYGSKDSIEGSGEGVIQLEVGTKRKPYVRGNYVFQSGICIVSVYNLIEKKFNIIPNSQVMFNGYPQEGVAYIKATYTQMASITEFFPKSTDKRPIPVEISLMANGRLGHPHITYGLFFPIKSSDFELNSLLEACMSKTLLDKSYLSKQILSVLVAKRVYNDTEIHSWEAINNSISDLLSQRIQDWASSLDQNLEVETDLAINQYKKKELNVLKTPKIKVSYRLWSGRIKVSSALGRTSTIINDWEIVCLLPKLQNMSAKMYSQPLTLESNAFKSNLFGIGLIYTQNFQ